MPFHRPLHALTFHDHYILPAALPCNRTTVFLSPHINHIPTMQMAVPYRTHSISTTVWLTPLLISKGLPPPPKASGFVLAVWAAVLVSNVADP